MTEVTDYMRKQIHKLIHYEELGYTNKEITTLLGVTCRTRIYQMRQHPFYKSEIERVKSKLKAPHGKERNIKKYWTLEETDTFIKLFYQNYTYADIAQKMRLTYKQVANRAQTLGLRKHAPLTQDQIMEIVELKRNSPSITAEQIAKEMGLKSKWLIYRHLNKVFGHLNKITTPEMIEETKTLVEMNPDIDTRILKDLVGFANMTTARRYKKMALKKQL